MLHTEIRNNCNGVTGVVDGVLSIATRIVTERYIRYGSLNITRQDTSEFFRGINREKGGRAIRNAVTP